MANTLFNQTSSNIKVSIGGSGGIENATSSNNITLTSVRSVSLLEPVPPLDDNVIVFALVAFSMPPLPPMLTFMFDEV